MNPQQPTDGVNPLQNSPEFSRVQVGFLFQPPRRARAYDAALEPARQSMIAIAGHVLRAGSCAASSATDAAAVVELDLAARAVEKLGFQFVRAGSLPGNQE